IDLIDEYLVVDIGSPPAFGTLMQCAGKRLPIGEFKSLQETGMRRTGRRYVLPVGAAECRQKRIVPNQRRPYKSRGISNRQCVDRLMAKKRVCVDRMGKGTYGIGKLLGTKSSSDHPPEDEIIAQHLALLLQLYGGQLIGTRTGDGVHQCTQIFSIRLK